MYHKEQRRAIEHVNGPALILAGPGSGKTTVIVERVRTLIYEKQIPPEKILVVTFTKAAALHMKQRFEEGSGVGTPVTFGTFHSVFFKILRESYGFRGNKIVSEREKENLIRRCMVELNVQCPSEEDYVANVLNEIGKIKGNDLSIKDYQSLSCGAEEFRKIYDRYQQMLKAEGKMDFDDILLLTKELFLQHPKVLAEWRNNYTYILIDEFQDINQVQYEIVQWLAAPANNLFVVGDDDQSIYGFRGARPEMMFRFQKDYPELAMMKLEINYRCSGNVVEASKKLIGKNRTRFEKNLVANKGIGKAVDYRKFQNQGEELRFIVQRIEALKKRGVPEEEIAILVRNNSQLPVFQKALQNNRIKSRTKGQGNGLYHSMVAKDLIAYIRAAQHYEQLPLERNEDLIAILQKPQRLISREMILKKGMTWEGLRAAYAHHREALGQVEALWFHLKMIGKSTPYAAINYIRKGAGYEEYLRQYAGENRVSIEGLRRTLERIQREAYPFQSFEEWFEMVRQQQERKETEKTGVQLLTMHGSKGLEFRVVFLPDMNQGIIPSKRTIREKEFEEERRVLYVAMTRAMEELYLFGCVQQLGSPMELSMFLGELLE